MRFSIADIATITGGGLTVAPVDDTREVCRLTWDSRSVEPGWAYVAIVGERADGNDFSAAAFAAGAAVAIMSREPRPEERDAAIAAGGAIVRVADGQRAIVDLASAWRGRIGARVVGVTGSVGKTTTKSLVRQVLSSCFRTCATKGNYNNQLGAPYTVLCADEDCEMLVVEMGMDHAGEIASICKTARPHMGVVTNVGVSHLEHLGTRENIARAKAELIEALPQGGVAFLHADDEFTPFIREHARADARGVRTVLFAGAANESDVYADAVRLDGEGRPSFTLHAAGASHPCELSLRGIHNVDNACAAAAVGLACGMGLAEVCAALAQAQPEAGRARLVRASCGAQVFDDAYNASPDSMKASLAMLAAYDAPGARVAVLGDMGELGSASDRGHEDVGRAAALAGVDVLVCVGERASLIARGALDAGMPRASVLRAEDAEDALGIVSPLVKADDVVLVKASHFMGLDRVVEGMVG